MNENPWELKKAKDFLFYCCAECNFKEQNEDLFIKHATENHPKSRTTFEVSNEKLVEVLSDLKVGELRFKCRFCDYKSKYKQSVTHHAGLYNLHLKMAKFKGFQKDSKNSKDSKRISKRIPKGVQQTSNKSPTGFQQDSNRIPK